MSEWIMVSDHYPDIGQMVLCSGNTYRVGPSRNYGIAACAWNGDNFCITYGVNNVITISDITHWMPLPEPPKD
jgi:hypothetical protein